MKQKSIWADDVCSIGISRRWWRASAVKANRILEFCRKLCIMPVDRNNWIFPEVARYWGRAGDIQIADTCSSKGIDANDSREKLQERRGSTQSRWGVHIFIRHPLTTLAELCPSLTISLKPGRKSNSLRFLHIHKFDGTSSWKSTLSPDGIQILQTFSDISHSFPVLRTAT